MKRTSEDPLLRWLEAEREDDPAAADAAFRSVLKAVPRREPSPDLSARLRTAVTGRQAVVRRASERAVAVGLVAAALVMTLLPVGLVGALFLTDAARIVSWLARTCIWLIDWLEAGASVWAVMAHTGSALGHAAVSPVGSAGLTIALLVASTALLLLNRFLPAERS